ncbi:MAG TPA: cob(I)yrinic acid a,c-diamide adenosyltransferase [Coriobacteriia bacterium]|nr:cob(I)yrinic acid a,c-diamide adenosyltransferase [Coriobacteriia bacterium]
MSGPIYTRRGDTGQTSIVGGARVPKDSARVEAYGSVDEANSAVGHARASLAHGTDDAADLDAMLRFVQHRLFDCASTLAAPAGLRGRLASGTSVAADDVALLESWIDRLMASTGTIDQFVLPAGCEAACRLHVARTVVRRAERRISELAAETPNDIDPHVQAFVNRLSDLLFAMARYVNRMCGADDEYWQPREP